jgi:hypothetical protein
MKKKILIIIYIFILFSCQKKIDKDIKSSDSKFVVIESIITSENIYQKVKLSYTKQQLNQTTETISNAEIKIFDGTDTISFTESNSESGTYYSNEKFIAVVNKIYFLSVKIEDKTYIASSNVIPVFDFEQLNYNLLVDSTIELTNLPPYYSPEENAMYEIKIDWSHLTDYQDSSYEKTHGLLYFYTLKTLDVPQIFAPNQENITFPFGCKITQKKYSLTDEHAEFYRSLLLETNWRGGIFDVEHGNVKTNFSNGALGFFGACTVIEKSFFVE